MKNKIITILLILNLITTIGMLNFFIKGKISKEKETLKEMTESEEVTGLQIKNLNQSHEEYANYIQESKIKIASAITNKGIETASTDTLETMINNIENISFNETLQWSEYIEHNKGTSNNGVGTYVRTARLGKIGFIEAYHDANSNGRCCWIEKALLPFEFENSYNWYMGMNSTTSKSYSMYFKEMELRYCVDPAYGSTNVPYHKLFIFGEIE